jgi:hypothetical protein
MKLSHNNTISMRYDIKRVIGKQNREVIALKRKEIQRVSTTESPERVYFCWFLSLKLILELEEREIKFEGESLIGEYKIDRKFYKEWNLDSLLHLSFYKWWEMHKTLFESPPVVERDNLKDWIPKPHYRYLRVDLRNNYTNIMKSVKREFDDLNGQKIDNKTKYPVIGKPQYDNEILSYNILVSKINGESNRDIFEKEIGRFKVVEKTHKSGLNAMDKDGEETIKKSKLMTSYDELQSGYEMSPEQRKTSKKRVFKSIMDEREESKYYKRETKTLGLIEGREFESILKNYINKNMKNYKEILCGVSQGQYRITDLEYQKKYRDKF